MTLPCSKNRVEEGPAGLLAGFAPARFALRATAFFAEPKSFFIFSSLDSSKAEYPDFTYPYPLSLFQPGRPGDSLAGNVSGTGKAFPKVLKSTFALPLPSRSHAERF